MYKHNKNAPHETVLIGDRIQTVLLEGTLACGSYAGGVDIRT